MFVTEQAFDAQLRHLRDSGWTPVDLDGYLAWLQGRRVARKSFLLTMDDAYVSTLEVAAPLLKAYDVPAVCYVPAGRIGGFSDWMDDMSHEPLLDWDGLRALADFGIEVGSHSWDHAPMLGMDAAALRRHTVEAAEALADVTGTRPRSFAYPWGIHDSAAIHAVQKAGYANAFAVKAGQGGRFAGNRVDVNATDTERTFQLKTTPWWPRLVEVADRAPALRRAARRLLGHAAS